MFHWKGNRITAILIFILGIVCTWILAKDFSAMYEKYAVFAGPGVTRITHLSTYLPALAGTPGDTVIFVLEGEQPGDSMLILGGTHPNEPAGIVATALLAENARPQQGTLYIIPRTNASAFTCTDPQEGNPTAYAVRTPNGDRYFRLGSRATNPVHQWPDPQIYVHPFSGQQLVGSDSRNVNRCYPGVADGSLTEQVCYAITQFIIEEDIDISVDLHEASPEYPTINAMVAHENAMVLASNTVLSLSLGGIDMNLEPSPDNFHGLSHRELGDATDTLAILLETANPAQGRYHGASSAELVSTGKDRFYLRAAENGQLHVPFDENGISIEDRVARHIATITELAKTYTKLELGNPIVLAGLPDYNTMLEFGLGVYLEPPTTKTARGF